MDKSGGEKDKEDEGKSRARSVAASALPEPRPTKAVEARMKVVSVPITGPPVHC